MTVSKQIMEHLIEVGIDNYMQWRLKGSYTSRDWLRGYIKGWVYSMEDMEDSTRKRLNAARDLAKQRVREKDRRGAATCLRWFRLWRFLHAFAEANNSRIRKNYLIPIKER